jgi:hypothetical protein
MHRSLAKHLPQREWTKKMPQLSNRNSSNNHDRDRDHPSHDQGYIHVQRSRMHRSPAKHLTQRK